MGKPIEVDNAGNLHLGPFGRASAAKLTIDFDAGDVDGIAIDVAPSPGAVSERASIKLGDFIIGQDTAETGTKNFGVLDANGVVIFSAAAGVDRATVVETRMTAAETGSAYQRAVTSAAYHANADTTSLGAAILTDPGDSAANAYARANLLKATLAEHFASVGTFLVVGDHLAADTALAATLAAVPAASSTGTLCTLTIALSVALIGHGKSRGVHFHDDLSTLGAGYVASSDLAAGNATLAKAITELNFLRVALTAHFANAPSAAPGPLPAVRTINAQTGTTYTLAARDGSATGLNPLLTLSNGAGITLTVPTNATVAFAVGEQIDLAQVGAGKVTVAAAGGVTLHAQGGLLSVAAQYAGLSLVQTVTDTWLVLGTTIA